RTQNKKQNFGLDKYLINIKTATKHTKGLIDNLMAYSRKEVITSETINVSSLLQEVMSMLSEILPSSIEKQIKICDSLPEIDFNRVQMQQIVTNLCINARDAIDSVGKLCVYLRSQEVEVIECASCGKTLSGKHVVLTIEDNGHGINNDDLKLIFKPLFTTKVVGKGTGLGLYVVNSVIHKYDGHIHVDSMKGKGTKFNVYFPVKQNSYVYEKACYGS
ncbi:MAG: HAMP domain-containing histidine kinase, partial [Gammaproteobacteria bacterium]|nr:HAMP domain-containing histidine kinase [Gammaproteobacteria bacterium]